MRIGIDIGGTFTDLVAVLPDGTMRSHKTSSTPDDYGIGILEGLQGLLLGEPVEEVLHATTIGANAILEGKGGRTALVTTAGFRDVLEIRDLRMPRLYDLHWNKPPPLVERRLRLEVGEKIRPDGTVALPLDPISVATVISKLRQFEVDAVAVCLMHSYANPKHERVVAAALRATLPGVAVTASHEILPEIKEYPRTSTTVVNAYLQPVLRAYLTSLAARLKAAGVDAPLRLMQSSGGVASAGHAANFPAYIVESGPAAGVVGAAVLAARLGEKRIITFDMGGTTAKAGVVEDGRILRTEAIEVGGGVTAGARLVAGAGYILKLPSVDLAEVGAGGGSLCRIDSAGAPKVGPESAGAAPGPVCYGRGGTEPTITDCNLALGYLDPGGLAGGAMKLDREAAEAAIMQRLAKPLGLSLEAAAHGMLRIASATMMRAIRAVSVERGRDCRQFTMLAFGGNGPLVAAGIAVELGIRHIIVPPLPGLFSALGLLLADTEHHFSRSIRMRVDTPDAAAFQATLDGLLASATARLAEDGFPPDRRSARISALVRYVGQSSEIAVPLPGGDAHAALTALPEAFAAEHARTYGFRAPPEEPVELIGLSLIARGAPAQSRLPERIAPATAQVPLQRRAWFDRGGWMETPVIHRAALEGKPREGPLLIQEYDATCLVPPGSAAALDAFGNIRIALG